MKKQKIKLPATIKALVMDFDGVFTDNTVIVFQDGREAVVCSRSDGWGFDLLRKAGIQLLVLSSEKNPIVRARCEKLKLPCIIGVNQKTKALTSWLSRKRIDPSEMIYIGNDDNDLGCLEIAGCSVVPADAFPRARGDADIVLQHTGGHGAIRELLEMIVATIRA